MARGKVVIIGGGIVGYNAAIIALGLGAQVTILERSLDRMRHLEGILNGPVTLLMSSRLEVQASVADADLVIGAVLIPGAVAPKLVTREMVAGMKAGSVIVDVAIDQGGCVETAHPTTHRSRPRRRRRHPLLRHEHAGGVPVTSTMALTNATLPYVEAIADHGLRGAVAADPALAKGVNVLGGKVTYEAVAEAHGLEFTPLDVAFALA